MRSISRTVDRPYDRVPSGIGEAENGDIRENREGPQHVPALLQSDATYSGYLTHSEAVGRRTETRGRPQLNPARLQPNVRDFGYIKNARIGVAGPARMRFESFPDRGGSRPEGVSL